MAHRHLYCLVKLPLFSCASVLGQLLKATGFVMIFFTYREKEKRIIASRGLYKEESDTGKGRRNGKGWGEGDYKRIIR